MPFQSQAQWRWAFATDQEFAHRWAKMTPGGKRRFALLAKRKRTTTKHLPGKHNQADHGRKGRGGASGGGAALGTVDHTLQTIKNADKTLQAEIARISKVDVKYPDYIDPESWDARSFKYDQVEKPVRGAIQDRYDTIAVSVSHLSANDQAALLASHGTDGGVVYSIANYGATPELRMQAGRELRKLDEQQISMGKHGSIAVPHDEMYNHWKENSLDYIADSGLIDVGKYVIEQHVAGNIRGLLGAHTQTALSYIGPNASVPREDIPSFYKPGIKPPPPNPKVVAALNETYQQTQKMLSENGTTERELFRGGVIAPGIAMEPWSTSRETANGFAQPEGSILRQRTIPAPYIFAASDTTRGFGSQAHETENMILGAAVKRDFGLDDRISIKRTRYTGTGFLREGVDEIEQPTVFVRKMWDDATSDTPQKGFDYERPYDIYYNYRIKSADARIKAIEEHRMIIARLKHLPGKHDQSSHGKPGRVGSAFRGAYSAARAGGASHVEARNQAKAAAEQVRQTIRDEKRADRIANPKPKRGATLAERATAKAQADAKKGIMEYPHKDVGLLAPDMMKHLREGGTVESYAELEKKANANLTYYGVHDKETTRIRNERSQQEVNALTPAQRARVAEANAIPLEFNELRRRDGSLIDQDGNPVYRKMIDAHTELRTARTPEQAQQRLDNFNKAKAAYEEYVAKSVQKTPGLQTTLTNDQIRQERRVQAGLVRTPTTPTTSPRAETASPKPKQSNEDTAARLTKSLENVTKAHEELKAELRQTEKIKDPSERLRQQDIARAKYQKAIDEHDALTAELSETPTPRTATPTTPTTPTATKADDSVGGVPRRYGARAGEVIAGNLGRDTGGKFTRVGGEGSIVRAAINRGFAAAGGGGKRGAKRAAVSAAQKKRQQADTGAGVMDKIGLDASDWDYLASDKPQDATDPQFARLIEQGLMDNVGGMAYPSALGRKVAAAAGAGNEDKAKELLARDTAKRNARQAKIDAQISAYDEIIGDKTASPRARAIAARKRTVLIGQSGTSTKADDGYTPPDGVRAQAKRGLALRSEFGRGGTSVGIARARDLSNGKRMSRDTIMRMASFFARHAVDKRPDWGNPSNPSNGYIAHLLWGGDAGKSWANKIANQIKTNKE